jgi:hypothetical protein
VIGVVVAGKVDTGVAGDWNRFTGLIDMRLLSVPMESSSVIGLLLIGIMVGALLSVRCILALSSFFLNLSPNLLALADSLIAFIMLALAFLIFYFFITFRRSVAFLFNEFITCDTLLFG